MKYLLDTHTAIWALDDAAKLSKTAKAIIDDTSIYIYMSIASVWEIAIKINNGKLDFFGGSESFLEYMRENGIEIVGVRGVHIKHMESLPFIHRDPFDRLLIATAQSEGLTILTDDDNIRLYDVLTLW